MSEPDWAKVLKLLHNSNGEFREAAQPDEYDKEPSHEEHERALYDALSEEIDFEVEDHAHIIETHKHLQTTGLVEFHHRSDYAALELTPDGFEVAHERELSSRNNRINFSLVFLTFILVIAQIVGVVPLNDSLKVSAGFLILIGMLVVVWQTDLLER